MMKLTGKKEFLLGVVSDTHGLVRPEVTHLYRGCDLILHAGDIGGPEILPGLEAIAPVVAVRGNVDSGAWAEGLPETEVVEVGGALLYLLHDLGRLDLEPAAAGFHAVIFGHSHAPAISRRDGLLFLNPGSAGPRRFRLPVTAAVLRVCGTSLHPEIKELTT